MNLRYVFCNQILMNDILLFINSKFPQRFDSSYVRTSSCGCLIQPSLTAECTAGVWSAARVQCRTHFDYFSGAPSFYCSTCTLSVYNFEF